MSTQDLDDVTAETYAVHNPDGSVSLDPYARKTRSELKVRCGELCRELDKWQHIAMALFEHGSLSDRDQREIERLIEAYRD